MDVDWRRCPRVESMVSPQPALAASEDALREKVALLAVMECAAAKPPGKRVLTFGEVAAATRLSTDLVRSRPLCRSWV